MAEPNLIVIEKEQIPSKSFCLTIKPPTYGDYREARKKFPYPSNNNSSNAPSYTVEELLFALSITSIDNRELAYPKDAIERLVPMSIADRQFLMLAFLEAFMLDPVAAKDAKALAHKNLSSPPELKYTIGRDRMPSGQVDLVVNRPNTGTQMSIDRKYQGVEQQGCSFEEMLFAMCLELVNGQPIERPADGISVLDNWSIADVQYATLVFINTFTLDDTGSESAKQLGKLMKAQIGSPKASSKVKGTTVPASE